MDIIVDLGGVIFFTGCVYIILRLVMLRPMTESSTHKSWRQDRERINVGEDYEVRYWSKKFGVTEDELRTAVRMVLDENHAPMVDLVAAKLGL